MTPPPPRKFIPWYLRVGALVLAGCIATYVIVLYVYGIKLVDLASKIGEMSEKPVSPMIRRRRRASRAWSPSASTRRSRRPADPAGGACPAEAAVRGSRSAS